MTDQKHDHAAHQSANHNKVHHDAPYWMRAHRDWRVWLGVILMITAMMIYVMTGDLSGWSHSEPRQPVSAPGGH
jgi:hypothetical protein